MATEPLKVVVVGAGIAGFAVAIALRRQGHIVDIYETSSFSKELGAAVHIGPHANGVLKRLGVEIRDTGAMPIKFYSEFSPEAQRVSSLPLEILTLNWQHEWLLTHRVKLHAALRKAAIEEEGDGPAATLHLANPVIDVDAGQGVIYLQDGTQAQGDVVIGADGIHSVSRRSVPGANRQVWPTGQSAFRFLIPRKELWEDPACRKFVEKDGDMIFIFGPGGKGVVMYPTSNNELINMVAFHPSEETVSTHGWGSHVSRQDLLRVFKDFHPDIIAAISKAEENSLKVWQLLDMETIEQWTAGKLALMGDAAHPFLPFQGQGACMAIEDAAALGVVLERGLPKEEVGTRLQLYQQIRQTRANTIQENSRRSGQQQFSTSTKDKSKRVAEERGQTFGVKFDYNHNHDEIDNSTQKLREWKLSQADKPYHLLNNVFDVAPTVVQVSRASSEVPTFINASVTIKSSLTLLKNLLPLGQQWSIHAPGTIAYFTFIASQNRYATGEQSTVLRFCIHNVEGEDGEMNTTGTFVPIAFCAGSEALQIPTCSSNVALRQTFESCHIAVSQAGNQWLSIDLDSHRKSNGVSACKSEQSEPQSQADSHLLIHQYQPHVLRNPTGGITLTNVSVTRFAYQLTDLQIDGSWQSKETKMSFNLSADKKLGDINHIVERLAELPVYGISKAQVVTGRGVLDTAKAVMLSQT